MDEGLFIELEDNIDKSLENKEISEDLLAHCEKVKEKFIEFEDKVIEFDDLLEGLKLFSASDTCISTLDNTITNLKEAKRIGENPISLEASQDILFTISLIGQKMASILNGSNSTSFNVKQIREMTLALQEEAEGKNLLNSIDDRLKETPSDLRKSIIQRVISH